MELLCLINFPCDLFLKISGFSWVDCHRDLEFLSLFGHLC